MLEGLFEKDDETKKRIIIIIAIILIFLIILFFLLFFKKQYEVTFNSNGGSEVASVKVKENQKVEKPEDPTREGFTFEGWYFLDELYDFETPIKYDITLVAEWKEIGDAEVEAVSLNATELTLAPDGTAMLVANLLPENAKQTILKWTSSDESIATVDENGNIKALKEGTVIITVETEDGLHKESCTITVTNQVVSVEGVSISGLKELNVGDTIKLTATVNPENASNKAITWSSSNKNIARVDQNGNVTGLKAGTVTIAVTTAEGGHKESYTITVKATTNTENNNNSTQSNTSTSSTSSIPTSSNPTTPSNPSQRRNNIKSNNTK